MATKVKVLVTERNGTELEYREEANPFSDLLQCFGLLCNEEITVAGGNADPSLVGFAANVGSTYFCGNGNIYQKSGTADTAWDIFRGASQLGPKWFIQAGQTQLATSYEVHNLEGSKELVIESEGVYQLDVGSVVTI